MLRKKRQKEAERGQARGGESQAKSIPKAQGGKELRRSCVTVLNARVIEEEEAREQASGHWKLSGY